MNSTTSLKNVGACVFDAYGTLFDVAAAAAHCRDALGDKADALSAVWRTKQLEYTWLRSLMGKYVDFRQVTGDGLDYAMASLGIENKDLRKRLMDIYMRLDAFPEVKDVLARLKESGIKTAILSNGSPVMLDAAVESAGIKDLLDGIISVDSLRIYKPHPSVYQLAVDGLGIPAAQICFMSSNAWDTNGAAAFGFKVIWVNRYGQGPEKLPGEIAREVTTLADLPAVLDL